MHKINWNKVLKIFVTILIVVIVFLLYTLTDCRTPAVRTRESLYRVAQCICDYVQSNKELPKTLKNLLLRNGHHNTIEDGWGNKIEYNIISDKLVTLMSFGADGKMVYAMLKQPVSTSFDDWMIVSMPSEIGPLQEVWENNIVNPPAFEQVVVNTLRELAKLNPQSHVHLAELYTALNVVYRCPPGPIMALLSSRPWFKHVGDLHFRFEDSSE